MRRVDGDYHLKVLVESMSRAGRSEQEIVAAVRRRVLTSREDVETIRLGFDAGSDRERRLESMRIGVLTGGGDCPGLNAVIRAVARRSWGNGYEVVGVREGWRGMVEHQFEPLGPNEISGILPRGGTIVGTSRTNPYKVDGGVEKVREGLRAARRARRDRRRGHARRRREALRRVRAAGRRRAEDDRQRPRPAPTTRSASTPPSRSAPRRSTASTRRRSRTTA